MKTKTDPKTMKTRTVLSSADRTAFAHTVDVLLMSAQIEGDTMPPTTQELADKLKSFVADHDTPAPTPKSSKDAPGQKKML